MIAMGRFNNLNDYVAALSPEEREKHKDLIAECMQRQRENRANTAASYDILNKIQRYLNQAAANLRQMGIMVSAGLEGQEASMKYAIKKLSYAALVSTPDEKFYRA